MFIIKKGCSKDAHKCQTESLFFFFSLKRTSHDHGPLFFFFVVSSVYIYLQIKKVKCHMTVLRMNHFFCYFVICFFFFCSFHVAYRVWFSIILPSITLCRELNSIIKKKKWFFRYGGSLQGCRIVAAFPRSTLGHFFFVVVVCLTICLLVCSW